MAKKILYILLGALLVFGVIFLIWSWFFSGSGGTKQTGDFGTASSTGANGNASAGQNTNGQTPIGSNSTNGVINLNPGGGGSDSTSGTGGSSSGGLNDAGTGGSGGLNGAVTGGSGGLNGAVTGGSGGDTSNIGVGSSTSTVTFTTSASGADWLITTGGGGGTTGSIGSGNTFSPTPINSLEGGNVTGSVSLTGTGVPGSSSGNSSIGIGLGAGLIGAITCAAQQFGILGSFGTGAGAAFAGLGTGVPTSDALTHGALGVQVTQGTANQERSFLACITNVIAKAALAQITSSVVNWINSGFNGQPSFITNYQQFFTNVADLAAGQFIQSSGLAFLCSPFQLQIKIAIAQSYAKRNVQSCSLTQVIRNVNSFMNGNFSQGGWGGFVSFTTVPTNNPYGAFAYAQIGLATAQSNALQNSKNGISPNGFLAVQQLNCNGKTTYNVASGAGGSQAALASGAVPQGCKAQITTPGTVIESSLASTLDTPLKQLGLANSLDQIINALLNQLMTRTLYGGLSNLSGVNGYQSNFQTPAEIQAQSSAQTALTDMQNKLTIAQQYGAIQQGSIADIQNAQGNLSTLLNCWTNAASSSSVTPDKQTLAATNAASTQATLVSLNAQITPYNDAITRANQEIVLLQQFETQALSATSASDVSALLSSYSAAQNNNVFITQADIVTAQQNRTTLQSQMSAINTATQTGINQCSTLS